MKKIFIAFFAILLSATVFWGCEKEDGIIQVEYACAMYYDFPTYIADMKKAEKSGELKKHVFIYDEEKVKMGNFERFCTYGEKGKFNTYTPNHCNYTFVTDNDIKFKLTLTDKWKKGKPTEQEKRIIPNTTSYKDEYLEEHKDYTKRYSPKNTADMRSFGKKITGVYTYNDVIRYTYEKGVLTDIHWILDNEVYVEISSGNFGEYPLDSDLIYSKLLNLDTVMQAVTETFGEPTSLKAFFEE